MRLAVGDVADRVRRLGTENVVLTGGEPLLQQPQLAELAVALKQEGKRIEVETSGTICPRTELSSFVDQWNVSPKLANSGNPLGKRQLPSVLEDFGRRSNAFFKFVVVEPEDLVELDELVATYAVPPTRVLLMPEGRSPEILRERSAWLAGACQQRGYRFTTRLHVLLWGDQRGR
jgi:organic radical activating enzyme